MTSKRTPSRLHRAGAFAATVATMAAFTATPQAAAITPWNFNPAVDIAPPDAGALRVADAEAGAAVIRKVLEGTQGPQRDIVLLNAACALAAAGLADDIAAGIPVAERSIDAGAAAKSLEALVRVSNA